MVFPKLHIPGKLTSATSAVAMSVWTSGLILPLEPQSRRGMADMSELWNHGYEGKSFNNK